MKCQGQWRERLEILLHTIIITASGRLINYLVLAWIAN